MTKKRRRKLRIRRKIIFTIFLTIVLIFVLIKYNEKEKLIDFTSFKLSTSYLKNITNDSGKTLKDEYKKVMIDYLDLYTDSLVNLKSRNVTDLFTDKDGIEAFLTQNTIDLQVYHHSIQINNMKLDNAYYDIDIKSIKENNNKITIKFIENDYYNFEYLDNITSKILGIENTFVLNDNNGKITIDSIRVERDNYVIFTSILPDNFNKNDIYNLKLKYEKLIKEEVSKNKELLENANNKEYKSSKKCDYLYNRENAVNYSYQYVDSRNNYYLDYSNLGGNCANFASQSIHEGGIPMDYTGNYQWKYFSDELNEENKKTGRSSSWVSTYYFYKYAKYNEGYGLCAEVDVNIYYAEIGDIIHVGYKDDNNYSHTTLVSKVIKKNNQIIDILVNSNTTNLIDYPVMGYIYQYKRLIKILGYND